MIIVQLVGGLGNQMFQYACGKSLAYKMKTKLVMDIHPLNVRHPLITDRKYELDAFMLKTTLLNQIPDSQLPEEVSDVVDTNHLKYNAGFAEGAGKNIYLRGYWQSWKYFHSIAPLIRRRFTVRKCRLSQKALLLADKIQQSNAVCIHVRRTDYAKPQNAPIGVLPSGYYRNAIRYIVSRINKPVFYLFSDERELCMEDMEMFREINAISIQCNTNIEDLYLMTRCRHHIIANSTYSWWGAWLNANSDKTVIAPDTWLIGAGLKVCDTDIIPPDWLSLPIRDISNIG
jgi:hypothetical protein